MKHRRLTRDIGPLALRASFSPSTLNEEKRTVDVTWTTGARVLRGFFDTYWEELSLDPKHVRMQRLQNGAPLLDTHNGFDLAGVLGVVEAARLEDGKGVATVRFARDEAGSAVLAKVKDGIIRHISVGYRTHRLEKIEGGDEKIPVFRATDWEPYELSMCPMAADDGASVRSGAAEANPCEFVEERKMKPKMKPPQGEKPPVVRTEEEQTDDDEEDAEETDKDEDETEDAETEDGEKTEGEEKRSIEDAARVGERKRIASIHRIAKTLDVSGEIAERHVNLGTSVAKFRTAAIDVRAKAKRIETGVGGAQIEAGQDARDKWLRGMTAWLLVRSATDRMVIDHAKTRGETLRLDPGEFRGLSLLEIARQALERGGVRTAGMSKHDLAGRALGIAHRAGGYQTTSDFPMLLEGTLNSVLLAAYATAPDKWKLFCATGSVSDFRATSRIRMGTFGRLDKVNEAGEFKNKPIPDGAAEEIFAETFGNIVAITRQAIINDDLGAFSNMATRLGRAARLSIEIDVFALLALNAGLGPVMADGLTLFHATHGNIGVGSVLGVAGLDADRVLMAAQRDPSGNETLDLKPSILLVPAGLEGAAKILNQSQYEPLANVFQKPNVVVGMFDMVVGTGRLTGTRRYVFANPADAPTIEVVFLDGQQTPFLETQEGWRIDGTEWKVRLDYGVGAVDFRGASTNAGV